MVPVTYVPVAGHVVAAGSAAGIGECGGGRRDGNGRCVTSASRRSAGSRGGLPGRNGAEAPRSPNGEAEKTAAGARRQMTAATLARRTLIAVRGLGSRSRIRAQERTGLPDAHFRGREKTWQCPACEPAGCGTARTADGTRGAAGSGAGVWILFPDWRGRQGACREARNVFCL